MNRKPYRKLSISVPGSLAAQIEKAAREECCTISELLRHAFRAYQAQRMALRLEAEKIPSIQPFIEATSPKQVSSSKPLLQRLKAGRPQTAFPQLRPPRSSK